MVLLKLNNIEGLYKKKAGKRLGRGRSSGKGKTSSRGMKGQKARFKVRAGFEGGQTPFIKRIPKIGDNMKLIRKNVCNVITTDALYYFFTSTVNVRNIEKLKINKEELKKLGFLKSKNLSLIHI